MLKKPKQVKYQKAAYIKIYIDNNMSDAGADPPKRSKKLPPISSEDGDEQKKPIKKKKKKAPSSEANGTTSVKSDETPRKKVVKKKDGEGSDKPTPKKRKKPTTTEEGEGDPSSARSAASKDEVKNVYKSLTKVLHFISFHLVDVFKHVWQSKSLIFLSCKLVSPLNEIIFSETKYLILQIVQSEK